MRYHERFNEHDEAQNYSPALSRSRTPRSAGRPRCHAANDSGLGFELATSASRFGGGSPDSLLSIILAFCSIISLMIGNLLFLPKAQSNSARRIIDPTTAAEAASKSRNAVTTRALKMAIARLDCRSRWERSIRPTVASTLLEPTPRDCDDHHRRREAAETDHD